MCIRCFTSQSGQAKSIHKDLSGSWQDKALLVSSIFLQQLNSSPHKLSSLAISSVHIDWLVQRYTLTLSYHRLCLCEAGVCSEISFIKIAKHAGSARKSAPSCERAGQRTLPVVLLAEVLLLQDEKWHAKLLGQYAITFCSRSVTAKGASSSYNASTNTPVGDRCKFTSRQFMHSHGFSTL